VTVTELYANLGADLALVEDKLHQRLSSSERILREAAQHLLAAGGKRLRPVFVLLSGSFGTYDAQRLTDVAVALELIHMATLVHDDVIDRADTRRGTPTVKKRFGNRMAMYTGDFMFAQALDILSQFDEGEMHRLFARAIWRMCAGEIEQIRDLFRVDQSLTVYLRRIRRKTAFLIEMSCALGALAAGATAADVSALRRFGYGAGMAFQITDDVLDLTSTAARLGKPVGSDLRQGNVTAPVILALEDPAIGPSLRDLIHPTQSDAQAEQAISLVRASSGIEASRALAGRYLQRARQALSALPETTNRRALETLAEFVQMREA